jgi:MoaA/NifB/PqqE/SkfB family radical SAM enzyme
MKIKVFDNGKCKVVKSEGYNSYFDKVNGMFIRYGKDKDDNLIMAPSWEILDWELSTKCNNIGICNQFCYKSNTGDGKTISFDQFKMTFDKLKSMNPIWHQVAYGIGSLEGIPKLPEILEYTRKNDVIPNITISSNEINHNVSDLLESISYDCGGVAISDNNIEDTIKLAKKLKRKVVHLKQINVHHVLSDKTFYEAFHMIDAMNHNPDIFNALVFLWIKPMGRAKNNFTQVNDVQLSKLLDYAMKHNVNVGFDTCGSHHAMKYYKSKNMKDQVANLIEHCCGARFSIYISVDGIFSPCSFCNDNQYNIDINRVTGAKDVWMSEEFMKFRKLLIDNGLRCPIYGIDKEQSL